MRGLMNKIETHVMVPFSKEVLAEVLKGLSDTKTDPTIKEDGSLVTYISFGPIGGLQMRAKLRLVDVHGGKRYLAELEGVEGNILEFHKKHFNGTGPSKPLYEALRSAINAKDEELKKAVRQEAEPEGVGELGHS